MFVLVVVYNDSGVVVRVFGLVDGAMIVLATCVNDRIVNVVS